MPPGFSSSSRRDDSRAAQPFKVGSGDFTIASVLKGRLNARMSYVSSYRHCVFSTKERRPLITPGLQERLWPYLGGIAREHKMTAVEIGGVADHVHMLLSLPSSMAIAKGIQLIKGGSSKWVHDTFPEPPVWLAGEIRLIQCQLFPGG